jgi:hypothetical protein
MYKYRSAIFRVIAGSDASSTIGTAFATGRFSLLTCYHVVDGINTIGILDNQGVSKTITSIKNPANPKEMDLSIIYIEEENLHYLPLHTSTDDPTVYNLMGYITGDTSKEASTYKLAARERKDVQYDEYNLPEAIELVGDIVGSGLSGSPLINPNNGCVSAIFCGGNPSLKRVWALPFSAIKHWDSFLELYNENDRNLIKFNSALNKRGAFHICSTKTQQTLKYYLNASKYSASLNVERSGLNESLKSFCKSNANIFALIGDANVGKSWALCDFVIQQKTFYPKLLINAAFETLNKLNLSPEDFCNQLLSHTNQSRKENLPFTTLTTLCQTQNLPIILILDGINEVKNFKHFVSQWLPSLVSWCCTKNVKLLISCRSEKWGAVSGHLSNMHRVFHQVPIKLDTERGIKPERQNHFMLGEFSIEEAKQAAQLYGLPQQNLHILDRHPLYYRVAHYVNLDSTKEPLGRYALINTFIDHQLNNAIGPLGLNNNHILWSQIKLIANHVEPNTGGLIEWQTALNLLEQTMLQELIDCGLLVSDKIAIKFAYDEVSDFLQDVKSDCLQQLQIDLTKTITELDQNSIYHALLYYEYTENEIVFSEYVSALSNKLYEVGNIKQNVLFHFDQRILLNNASITISLTIRILKALPASRRCIQERLISALCAVAETWFLLRGNIGNIINAIEGSSLSNEYKMELLLKLLYLDNSWPLRLKDWQSADQRDSFVEYILGHSDYVASAINQLYKTDPVNLRPQLLERLNDETPLLSEHTGVRHKKIRQGEASISSACAGLLYGNAKHDGKSLISDLLKHHCQKSLEILATLAIEVPSAMASALLFDLKHKGPPSEYLLIIIEASIHYLKKPDQILLSEQLNKIKNTLPSINQKQLVLQILRITSPNNLCYWDELLEIIAESGNVNYAYSLVPIPDSRQHILSDLVNNFPLLTYEIMNSALGIKFENNSLFVEIYTKLSNNQVFIEHNERKLAFLLKKACFRSVQSNVLCEEHLTLINTAAITEKVDTLECLIDIVFNDSERYKYFEHTTKLLISNPIFSKNIKLVVQKLNSNFDIQMKQSLYHQYRALNPSGFDEAIIEQNINCCNERYSQLVQFWQTYSTQQQTFFSKHILERHYNAKFTGNPFDLDECTNILNNYFCDL